MSTKSRISVRFNAPINHCDEALTAALDDESRIKLTSELFKVWLTGTSAQVDKAIGWGCQNRSKNAFMIFTDEEGTLQVWCGPDNSVTPYFVNTFRAVVVCEVKGDSILVARCQDAFLEAARLAATEGSESASGMHFFAAP